jgi:hypothetical protein
MVEQIHPCPNSSFNGVSGLDPEKSPATNCPIHSDWIEPKESRVQIWAKFGPCPNDFQSKIQLTCAVFAHVWPVSSGFFSEDSLLATKGASVLLVDRRALKGGFPNFYVG